MKAMTVVMLTLASLSGVAGADAAESSAYIGASIGAAQTRTRSGDVILLAIGGINAGTGIYDTRDSGYKLIGGFRPLDWFGVEGGYVDLGEIRELVQFPDASDLKSKQKVIDVFGVFYFDAGKFAPFVKAGLARYDADRSFSSFAGPRTIRDRDTDFAWGAGVERGFERFAVRFEYERFAVSANYGIFHDPDLISAGFTWTIR